MRYALWAGLFLLGCAAGWGMRSPVVKVEERIVVKQEVKWRTNERIVTLPGATVYRDREGNTTITGPVEITSTGTGESVTASDVSRKTESCPPPPGYALGASWGMRLDGSQSYGLLAGRRMLGPIWLYAQGSYPLAATVSLAVVF